MERSVPLKAKCKVTHSSPRNTRCGTPCWGHRQGGGHQCPPGDRKEHGESTDHGLYWGLCVKGKAGLGESWGSSGLKNSSRLWGGRGGPKPGHILAWNVTVWYQGGLENGLCITGGLETAVAGRWALHCNSWIQTDKCRTEENTFGGGGWPSLSPGNSESRSWNAG